MKENQSEWRILKKVGPVKNLSSGSDSEVYHVESRKKNPGVVAKEYTQWRLDSNDPKDHENILRQYYADTEKAIKWLSENHNPLEQHLNIGAEEFPLYYEIIPQGPIILKTDLVEDGPTRTSLGQEFIDGLTLPELMRETIDKGEIAKPQRVLASNRELCRKLDKMIEEFFHKLRESLDIHFIFNPVNAKPFLDIKEKKMRIVITDLAANLKSYYEHRFKETKKKL